MHRSLKLVPMVALPALMALYLVLGAGASAQSPGGSTITVTELEKGATFTHIRNTKPKTPNSNPQGDLIAFTNPLADSSGRVIGKLQIACVTTTGAKVFTKSAMTCSGILALPEGSLTIQANVSPGESTTTAAVTGGTGAYTNAAGSLVSKKGPSGTLDTITLAS